MHLGGDRKERKENEDVINNVIITSTPTTRLIVTFSIPPQLFPIWQKFLKVAKREGGSRGRSQVLLKAVADYVKRHELGNPQIHLTTYMDPSAPSPMRVLCWTHLAGATTEGKVYCRKYGGSWVQAIKCYSCPENQLRKKKEP